MTGFISDLLKPFEFRKDVDLSSWFVQVDPPAPEVEKFTTISFHTTWVMKCDGCGKFFELKSKHFLTCDPLVIDTTARDIYPELQTGTVDDGAIGGG